MTVLGRMRHVCTLGRFSLWHAQGAHFNYPGYQLWTGRGHRQVWPLRGFWRRTDR